MFSLTVQGETMEDVAIQLMKAYDEIGGTPATGKATGTAAGSKPKPAKKAPAKKAAAKKEEDTTDADGPTADDVKDALKAYAEVEGRPAAIKILKSKKADSVSDLDPSDYADVITAAALTEAEEDGGDDEDDGF